jgi:hypothetical protein
MGGPHDTVALVRSRLVGLLVTWHSKDRSPAPPGKDADPQESRWDFKWSRTPLGGDRRSPISGGTSREGPLAAWLVTGPLGHLYAGLADWAELLLRLLRARVGAIRRGRRQRPDRR